MKKSMVWLSFAFVAFAFFNSGCATSQKVEVAKVGDHRMTCSQLEEEYNKLQTIKADVEKNKSWTGTNIAALVFFFPGLVFTHVDARKAEDLLRERETRISELADKKGCPPFKVKTVAATDVKDKKEEAVQKDSPKPETKEVKVEQVPATVSAAKLVMLKIKVGRTANMRSTPSVKSKLIINLKGGTEVEKLDEKDVWFKVRYIDGDGNQKDGWIRNNLIE